MDFRRRNCRGFLTGLAGPVWVPARTGMKIYRSECLLGGLNPLLCRCKFQVIPHATGLADMAARMSCISSGSRPVGSFHGSTASFLFPWRCMDAARGKRLVSSKIACTCTRAAWRQDGGDCSLRRAKTVHKTGRSGCNRRADCLFPCLPIGSLCRKLPDPWAEDERCSPQRRLSIPALAQTILIPPALPGSPLPCRSLARPASAGLRKNPWHHLCLIRSRQESSHPSRGVVRGTQNLWHNRP